MEQLRHSNYNGTVGWTSIWALMDEDDIKLLFSIAPRGSFVVTASHLVKRRPNESIESFHRRCEIEDASRCRISGSFMSRRKFRQGYYFNFPEDKEGIGLLSLLVVVHGMDLDTNYSIGE